MYYDTANVLEVIVRKKKIPLYKNADISLYGDRVVINEGKPNELLLLFSQISVMAALGRNKLNIYVGDKVYQFKGDKRFCALKYVNIYYHRKNQHKGEEYGQFLGL